MWPIKVLTILLLLATPVMAWYVVYTDVVSEISPDVPVDTLFIGAEYAFRTHVSSDYYIGYLYLGFQISTEDGIIWSWKAQPGGYPADGSQAVTVIPGSRIDPAEYTLDMTGLLVTEQDIDGSSPDTIMWFGVAMAHGIPSGPLEPMTKMHFKLEDMDSDFGMFCIDSSFVPPAGKFCIGDFLMEVVPRYDGPFCWPVKRIMLGDFDLDGQISVGDAVAMIQVIFKGKPHPAPIPAGDVNCDGSFNVGDAIYLIAYIFKHGPAPGCP